MFSGKRKRSNREKSQEPDHLLLLAEDAHSHQQQQQQQQQPILMDCDNEPELMGQPVDLDQRSSSSLSSSEWEEEGKEVEPYHWQVCHLNLSMIKIF